MEIVAGSLVYSAAGRDKDRAFLVLSVEGNMCTIADGKLRKCDNPKKKKMKHLTGSCKVSSELQEKLSKGETPTNSEIRKFLKLISEEA